MFLRADVSENCSLAKTLEEEDEKGFKAEEEGFSTHSKKFLQFVENLPNILLWFNEHK